ncbi:hypothetical protein D3C80_2017670 [compost metagenome]
MFNRHNQFALDNVALIVDPLEDLLTADTFKLRIAINITIEVQLDVLHQRHVHGYNS